ncbi:MAG: EamA family transporter [Burkholderiaceae bacterium]|nr:EamA family transporter [Burkholderiaceae bacterium]
MTSTALALVLLAALCHAVWNVAAKSAGGDARFALLSVLLVSALWLPLALWFGWDVVGHWGLAQWGIVVASAVVHVSYFLTLLRGYRAADLTVVYPVARGSAPLLSAGVALLLFGEQLSALGVGGVLMVVAGVFLIAGGPGLMRAAHDPVARRRVWLGVGWGAATGVQIAGYTLIDGYAVKVLLLSPILVDYFGNLLRIPILLPLVWRDRATLPALWRTQWRAALLVATLGPIGYVLVLFAMQRAPVSLVAPAREVSMLFAALLGGTLLREKDMAARVAGALCIALGVAALVQGAG